MEALALFQAAQHAAQQAAVPAGNGDLHLGSTITESAMVVFIMQWLKNLEKIPFISHETPRINRLVAILLSGVGALGITWVFAPSANGAHTLTIQIPSLVGMVSAGWIWLKSFAIQEWIYQSSANRPRAGDAPAPMK